MERKEGRGDRNGWELNECDRESDAGNETETAQWQGRGLDGREGVKEREVIPSARIYVSINGRTGVCLAPLSGWPVELAEGALHSRGGGRRSRL